MQVTFFIGNNRLVFLTEWLETVALQSPYNQKKIDYTNLYTSYITYASGNYSNTDNAGVFFSLMLIIQLLILRCNSWRLSEKYITSILKSVFDYYLKVIKKDAQPKAKVVSFNRYKKKLLKKKGRVAA